MPYIADYLWQDVLAAARKLIPHAHQPDVSGDELPGLADELKAALEAAEGGSDTTENGPCATG